MYIYIYTRAYGPRHPSPQQNDKFLLVGVIVIVEDIVIYILGPAALAIRQHT